MNNFNDYYNYMIGNTKANPSAMGSGMVNPGLNYEHKVNFDNNVFQDNFMNLENSPRLYNPNEGFTKGNMFSNLYDPYKNYKPMEITASSERQNLMQQIQMYKFAMNDLVLYLDVNPKNTSLIKTYNDYLMKYRQLVDQYEKMYGPLSNDGMLMPTNDWVWNNSPWPWEVER